MARAEVAGEVRSDGVVVWYGIVLLVWGGGLYDVMWVNDSEEQAIVSTETDQTEAKQEQVGGEDFLVSKMGGGCSSKSDGWRRVCRLGWDLGKDLTADATYWPWFRVQGFQVENEIVCRWPSSAVLV